MVRQGTATLNVDPRRRGASSLVVNYLSADITYLFNHSVTEVTPFWFTAPDEQALIVLGIDVQLSGGISLQRYPFQCRWERLTEPASFTQFHATYLYDGTRYNRGDLTPYFEEIRQVGVSDPQPTYTGEVCGVFHDRFLRAVGGINRRFANWRGRIVLSPGKSLGLAVTVPQRLIDDCHAASTTFSLTSRPIHGYLG